MFPLLVLLAAAPASKPEVVLEPDPGPAHRLHPRRMMASSFLKNGWNRFEQNYLPPYAADDDPASAWVEGVPGNGEGESLLWEGPTLRSARQYRVFLRNGYQKSKRLYEANSRPRKVRLEPILGTEGGWSAAGKPVEVELADQLGWQEVRVPTQPGVTGIRLTLVSVYPGSVYTDTCLSDMRVYVEGDDPYREDLESLAREEIRRFVLERKQAEARGAGKAALEIASEYTPAETASHAFELSEGGVPRADKVLEALKGHAAFSPALARVKQLLDGFDNLPVKRVRVVSRNAAGRTASVALAAMKRLDFAQTLFATHVRDLALFEANQPQSKVLSVEKNVEWEDMTSEVKDAFVIGELANPTALLLRDFVLYIGGRMGDENEGHARDRLLIFEKDVALGVAIRNREREDDPKATYELDIPEWKRLPNGRVHLAAVYVLEFEAGQMKGTVYREKV